MHGIKQLVSRLLLGSFQQVEFFVAFCMAKSNRACCHHVFVSVENSSKGGIKKLRLAELAFLVQSNSCTLSHFPLVRLKVFLNFLIFERLKMESSIESLFPVDDQLI